jgi:hypothetical protein
VDSPATDDLSPSEARRLRSVGRIIDEADRQIRNGKIDETLLKDLGMNEAEFASFVEAYRERFDNLFDVLKATDPASGSTPEPNDLPGDPNLRRGEQAAPGVGAIRGSEKIEVDDSQELLESRRKEVSSEFRKEVEGYFRAVSDQPVADKPATQPAK